MASLFVLEPFTLLSPYSPLEIRPEAIAFCGSCKGHSFTTVPAAAKSNTDSQHALPQQGPQVTLGKFWGFVSKSGPS